MSKVKDDKRVGDKIGRLPGTRRLTAGTVNRQQLGLARWLSAGNKGKARDAGGGCEDPGSLRGRMTSEVARRSKSSPREGKGGRSESESAASLSPDDVRRPRDPGLPREHQRV